MPEIVLQVSGFFHSPTKTITYVIADPVSRRAAVIDPVLDFDGAACLTASEAADDIIAHVRQERLVVDWILETHLHEDHLTAAPYIRAALGGAHAIGAGVGAVQKQLQALFNLSGLACDGRQFDRLLENGASFNVGDIPARAYAMPGHSGACSIYLIGDCAFTGDTLLMPDNGTARCDLPGGSAAEMYRSVRALYGLPPETRLFPGHDPEQKGRDIAYETTIAEQREKNVHIQEKISEADFISFRERRDRGLSKPDHYFQALQYNMAGGALPPPDSNGISYFRIPVNAVPRAAKPFKLKLVH